MSKVLVYRPTSGHEMRRERPIMLGDLAGSLWNCLHLFEVELQGELRDRTKPFKKMGTKPHGTPLGGSDGEECTRAAWVFTPELRADY